MTGVASAIERVGVVGGGLMGSGIAEVCSRRGYDVIVKEISEAAVAAAQQRLETSLRRAVRAGKLEEDESRRVGSRVRFTTDFADLADRQFAIEAIVESETEKLEVFAMLDKT
ncbi:MAG: 3-hydroxyacyl-CoA dehydrogenase NAD-binding domain-containing protein, partial [Acidimicrobiia bacterium]